jgi:hypothetical protein
LSGSIIEEVQKKGEERGTKREGSKILERRHSRYTV